LASYESWLLLIGATFVINVRQFRMNQWAQALAIGARVSFSGAVARADDAGVPRLLRVRDILEGAAACCCARDFGRHNKQCRGSSTHAHQPPGIFVPKDLR
jgi:hypothetical protein